MFVCVCVYACACVRMCVCDTVILLPVRQVSYLATMDLVRVPCAPVDWAKLLLFDTALNWTVIVQDAVVNALLLLAYPVTLVMYAVSLVLPAAGLPNTWLQTVYRLSGFNP